MQKIAHSEIKLVMRRSEGKVRDYARRHGIARWTTDADEVLHDSEINAIYIATPPSTHAEFALRAAEAGKAVYVEKPMARTYAECQQMVDAFRQADLPLWVAYYRRALPNFLHVKTLLDDGAIGTVPHGAYPLAPTASLQFGSWHRSRLAGRPGGGGRRLFPRLGVAPIRSAGFLAGSDQRSPRLCYQPGGGVSRRRYGFGCLYLRERSGGERQLVLHRRRPFRRRPHHDHWVGRTYPLRRLFRLPGDGQFGRRWVSKRRPLRCPNTFSNRSSDRSSTNCGAPARVSVRARRGREPVGYWMRLLGDRV